MLPLQETRAEADCTDILPCADPEACHGLTLRGPGTRAGSRSTPDAAQRPKARGRQTSFRH